MSELFEVRVWSAVTGGILAHQLNGPLSWQFFVAVFAYAAAATLWVNYLKIREQKRKVRA